MPHWLIKAAVQRGISLLPKSHVWNELLQEHVTKSIELTPDRFNERLDFCRRHVENLIELGPKSQAGFRVLEIGTGWQPIVPIGLYLCGATEVHTFDIAPHLSAGRLRKLLEKFGEYAHSGELRKRLPQILPECMEKLQQLTEKFLDESPYRLLEKIGVHARVRDAQHTGLEPGTVDLIVSTGVLEYIPVPVLKNVLAETARVAAPGAVTSHYLNLIDQYSYFDSSIGPLNFLKFADSRWKIYNSPLTWLNRLRISDYRRMFADAGFPLAKEINTLGSEIDLNRIRLAPEFQNYSKPDLLVLTSFIAGKFTGGKR
jgi:hypothetical protein